MLKTGNGGGSWSQVMQCTGNANIATGWTGDDPGGWNWKKWSWGECAMGFTVCASDPNRAVISDFGFIHVTTNGGASWRQAYDWQGCENAAGVAHAENQFLHGQRRGGHVVLVAVVAFQQHAVLRFHRHPRDAQHQCGRHVDGPDVAPYNSTYQTRQASDQRPGLCRGVVRARHVCLG